MKALVQRVSEASVEVDGKIVGNIGSGMVILLGIRDGDSQSEADFIAKKCASLRIFDDQEGKMNCDISDVSGEFLVVSQFTLYGDCRKGRRPSYVDAARPEVAEPLYEYFVDQLRSLGCSVRTGQFQTEMKVRLLNDGPVTLMIEKENSEK